MYDDEAQVITTDEGVFRIRLEQDLDAASPREEDDLNAGTMVLFHRRYDLPCEGELAGRIRAALDGHSWAVVARWLRVCHGASVVLPVWGYDHGALHVKAGGRTYPFGDRWDSGFLGLIYDTPAAVEARGVRLREPTAAEVQRWAGGDLSGSVLMGERLYARQDMTETLAAEVALYDHWANGGYVGFVVEKLITLYVPDEGEGFRAHSLEWEVVDSCGDIDDPEYAMREARDRVPGKVLGLE